MLLTARLTAIETSTSWRLMVRLFIRRFGGLGPWLPRLRGIGQDIVGWARRAISALPSIPIFWRHA